MPTTTLQVGHPDITICRDSSYSHNPANGIGPEVVAEYVKGCLILLSIPTSKPKPQSHAAAQRSHISLVRPANRLGRTPSQINEGQQVWHLRTTFAFAQQRLQNSAEGQKAYCDRKVSHKELDVGDKIWYYHYAQPFQTTYHRLSKKFQTLPCRISDQAEPGTERTSSQMGPLQPDQETCGCKDKQRLF
ncbi:hypothetical protein QQF64_006204 [Cirrhinus molitorella]|uniref:Uncharacterized protein n=1 Tax=Cirrhinus molitorella TaxID=172907 RepID=A0ABR3MEF1_9TELE